MTGTGWPDLCEDGCLEGEILYDNGEDTSIIAKPRLFQRPVKAQTRVIIYQLDQAEQSANGDFRSLVRPTRRVTLVIA